MEACVRGVVVPTAVGGLGVAFGCCAIRRRTDTDGDDGDDDEDGDEDDEDDDDDDDELTTTTIGRRW